jgi:tRNA threonylcarbamoyl adenosine modification protein YjeE
MRTIHTQDEAGTETAGAQVAAGLKPGDVIGLAGPLGAGKTVFVRGTVRQLGGDPAQVRSPTFTLMNVYSASIPIFHFDLYRLARGAELDGIGFHEFARGDGVSLVEWADRFPDAGAEVTVWVQIEFDGPGDRRIITVSEVPLHDLPLS